MAENKKDLSSWVHKSSDQKSNAQLLTKRLFSSVQVWTVCTGECVLVALSSLLHRACCRLDIWSTSNSSAVRRLRRGFGAFYRYTLHKSETKIEILLRCNILRQHFPKFNRGLTFVLSHSFSDRTSRSFSFLFISIDRKFQFCSLSLFAWIVIYYPQQTNLYESVGIAIEWVKS